jgi:hypothetical protein
MGFSLPNGTRSRGEREHVVSPESLGGAPAEVNARPAGLGARGLCAEALKQECFLSYLELRGSPKELKAIRARLMKLIGSSAGQSKSDPSGPAYRLTIAFFPLVDGRRST